MAFAIETLGHPGLSAAVPPMKEFDKVMHIRTIGGERNAVDACSAQHSVEAVFSLLHRFAIGGSHAPARGVNHSAGPRLGIADFENPRRDQLSIARIAYSDGDHVVARCDDAEGLSGALDDIVGDHEDDGAALGDSGDTTRGATMLAVT